jgi:hypothetical protein
MAITAADLKQPKGPITPAMFPGVASNVLDANLEIYIDTATADSRITADPDQSKTDQRVRALALYSVFNDAFIEANAKPLTLTQSEKGGHGYSIEQVRNWRRLADGFLVEFLGLLTPSAGSARRGGTVAVSNSYTF